MPAQRRPLATLLTAFALVLLTAVAALAGAQPGAAHGDTIHFEVTALVDGHTRAVATWENDGDPVTETVAAMLRASATDGRAVGPWPLVRLDGSPNTFTTADALPPGQWRVSVEAGFPALGRGQADVSVTALPAPTGAVSSGAGPSGPASPGPASGAGSAGPAVSTAPTPAATPPAGPAPVSAPVPHASLAPRVVLALVAVGGAVAVGVAVGRVRRRRRAGAPTARG
ncbi:hypothetical protein ACFW1A_32300 [Kitasatospora sp. NPDC058965]|uniref:hypothetical protein n=1 Tax=Kitasatospora sp. NPDC058965 TaxID=3346682 RepID=UPI0036A26884